MLVQKLSLAAIILAGLSFAAPQATAKDFTVKYKPSEVQTAEGRANVYARIEKTARELCAYQYSPPYAVLLKNRMDRCLRRTVEGFIRDIDQSKLTALHAAKTQKTPDGSSVVLAQQAAE